MLKLNDIENLFDGDYINLKFVEVVYKTYDVDPEDFDKEFHYFFRIYLNSGEFEDSRSFPTMDECEFNRKNFISLIEQECFNK
jgi:hypothetical protein